MYNILYHGQHSGIYDRLKTSMPDDVRLRLDPNRDRFLDSLARHRPHGIILPLSSPTPDDLRYLRRLVDLPEVPGIIVTAEMMSAAQAVCCMRSGAYDCLTGPVTGEVLGAAICRMIGNRTISKTQSSDILIFGDSREAINLRRVLGSFAALDKPVLLTGETGSGKELAAKTIHRLSPRHDGPFVAVNCASYPDELLSSELFGSNRGAYTGSIDRPGFFEAAHGGTLFLDEIGELSQSGQVCFLRVLEEGRVRRIGSNQMRRVDVRIIAATNRDLRESMRIRRFRQDLYYRLNILGVTVPPLRKRRADIPVLTRNYLITLKTHQHWRVDSRAMALLAKHDWPGNVRELQSVLLKATLTAEKGLISAGDIKFD
ncbi:MAG: sigma-54 dependent transcriptional regulator [Spirochaetaceae bacterium]|nr:sigma-54 dependent transcriptional regulator [Spirochaetaceae bacterium]